MSNRYKILIDTDPGYDDALAILLASSNKEKLNVVGITTVFGNSTLKVVNNNLVELLNYYNINVPYAFGAEYPINGIKKGKKHSEADLFNLPFSICNPNELKAEHFLMNVLKKSEELITVVSLGPLTNIAKLINEYPEIINKIDKIVIMGGAINNGNITSVAEFNIFCDPEAAKIVFTSGIKIILASLEVTRRATLKEIDFIEIEKLGEKQKKIAEIIKKSSSKYGLSSKHGIPIHDVCTIMYLTNPEIFKTVKYNISIETKGELTRGMTVVDRRPFSKSVKNVEVITDINEEKFTKILIDALSNI